MSAGVYRPLFWRIAPPSQRNAGATFTAPLAAPTSWWQAYRVGSTDPSFVAEFTGQGTTGRFYDGSATTTTPATYIGGSITIDATSGLHNASGGLTAIGALKTALTATDRTVVMVLTGGVNGEFSGALSFGSDSPLYHNNIDNSLRSYFNSTATSLDTVGYIPNWAGRVFLATAMGSSGRKVTVGGSGVVFSDTHVFTTPTNVQIMDYLDPAHEYYGGTGFGGRLEKIIVYPTYMSDADLMAAAAPRAAFDGGYGVSFPKAAYSRPRDPSNLLQFGKTQAWTFYTAGIISAIPHTANASADFVFFTTANKGSSTSIPYGGFEFFADGSTGVLWVRIMAAYYGTNVDYLGVSANSTAVIDGAYHTYAVTYDGSGNRSGIKIYIDGVSQTLTNEAGSQASLTGNTNTNSSDFIIGNQLQTGTDPDWSQQYYMTGTMDYAMLDKVAASAGTISGITPASPTPPAAGVNTAFRYMFNEGSGTVVADDAGNFTLDLSSGALWVSGTNSISTATIYNDSISLAVATAIDTNTGTTKVSFPTATLSMATAETPSSVLQGSSAATLNVSPVIAAAGSLNFISTATIAFTPVIAAAGGLNFISAATINFSPVIAAAGKLNLTATATINFSPVETPAGTFSAVVSAALAAHPVIAAAGNFSANVSGSLATATGIASLAGLIASASATLAVSTAQASSGGALYSGSATLNVSPFIAANGQLNVTSLATLAAATGLSASAIETIAASASLAVATAIAPSAADIMNASASIAVHPAIASAGGNAFTSALSFALTTSIVAAVAATLSGSGTLAAVAGLSGSARDVMTASGSLALSPGVAPSATDTMTAAATIGGFFAEQASLNAQAYSDAIALAATATLVSAGRLDAAGAAAVSAVISELTQSAAVMQAIGSLSTSIATATVGALRLFQNMTLSTSAGVGIDGRTTVNGSIGFGAAAGSVLNLNLGAAGQLSFAATYDVEPGNVLTASDAVTIATHLVIRSLVGSEHPLAEVLSVKGIWQGEFNLAGVYEAEKALNGVVQMAVALDGRA